MNEPRLLHGAIEQPFGVRAQRKVGVDLPDLRLHI
jgi:hypothetical protein